MSNLDRLKERGAQIVGGDLVLRGKTVGQFRNRQFYPTEEGLLELETIEVVAKEVKPAAKPKKAKTEVEAPVAAEGDLTIEV